MAHIPELGQKAAGYFNDTAIKTGGSVTGHIYRRYLKRIFDILAVLLAAPFILPVVLLIAMLVKRDGGPVFYRQKRIGRQGRVFRIWKLRSMVVDADQLLETHLEQNPDARAEWDRTQKLKNDPRITPAGRLIRKTSLDELPQLWNVLKGEMSLVGPRPMLPEQAPDYPGRAYYSMRPGLTGFWQISSRNETSFAARATFDNRYARKMSLRTDLLVIFATVRVVLRGTGY